MGTLALLVLVAAVATLVVQTASLFSANEGFRGAGRVFGGASILLLGIFVHAAASNLGALVSAAAVVIGLCGLITVAAGVRKYLRRNAA